ncbi:putative transcriptional regulator [Frankia canadensis]|uniref:Putative transcriptional regulator n=1 Tax=Frankia canadensis TaxID=1836972 RepID=A0A2I2KRK5_9ACTN|nr:LuxR C-terminal-related transcriptional regulator [Frankia canadensis]SNQ48301.1 putative transcriptional regulator [Frankia canadensis]SOU55591.1 putative transcriptional regulator [Frankia canadensis]
MTRSQVPADLTRFVGRDRECAQVAELLAAGRLMTLTGPGGVGKTRLAKEVVRRAAGDLADSVVFVELAEVAQGDQVFTTIAGALGLALDGGESPRSLATALAECEVLLVLDNCEHVLAACGRLIGALLPLAPGARVLATSREPLGILGERTWRVPPLSLPAPASNPGIDSDAVQLFLDRALSVAPEFAVTDARLRMVGDLCRRLDGIPLAIELAAVRTRAFDLPQMLSDEVPIFRVLDRGNETGPSRHHTLRKAIEWSHDLCTDREQALWSRLAVFSGSFGLAAAREVCAGDGLTGDDVVALIGNLVEKSVVTCNVIEGAHRYRLLESLREFGLERCEQRETWRRRHRDYYLGLALASTHTSTGDEQLVTVRRLQGELPNIRSAVDYSLSRDADRLVGLEMTGALWFYWNACGHLRDGCRWLQRALEENPESTPARAKALWVLGWYEMVQGDKANARLHLETARDMGRALGDRVATATATQFLGTLEELDGNTEGAMRLLEEAERHHREASEQGALSILCGAQLAMAHCLAGRLDEARRQCDAAVARAEAHDERWAASWARWNRGLLDHFAGQASRSVVSLRTALTAKAALCDWLGASACVEIMAWNAADLGRMAYAARLLGIGHTLCRAMGGRHPLFGSTLLTARRARYVARIRQAIGADAYEREFAAGRELEVVEAAAFVLDTCVGPDRLTPVGLSRQDALTAREREISRLIYQGLSNADIAASLTISRRTVEGHVNRILAKLNFRSRSQVAVWMARREPVESGS